MLLSQTPAPEGLGMICALLPLHGQIQTLEVLLHLTSVVLAGGEVHFLLSCLVGSFLS